jgi:hypothetical protein
MRIDSAGNVGIGETAPTYGKLVVMNGGDLNSGLAMARSGGTSTRIWKDMSDNLRFSTGGGADLVTIQQDGNVGIGTTGPAAPLHVTYPYARTDTTERKALIISSNDYDSANTLEITAVGHASSQNLRQFNIQTRISTTNTGYLNLQPKGGNVGIGTTTPTAKLQVTDTYNMFIAGSGLGTGANFYSDNSVYYGTTGNNSANFFTNNLPRMKITNDGLVGIGTTTPQDKLHVAGTSVAGGSVNLWVSNELAGTTAAPNYMGIMFGGWSNFQKASITALEKSGNNFRSDLIFSTNVGTNATSLVEAMRINDAGYVGIGTAAPGTNFQVAQPTTGVGTVSNSAGGTTVTGVNTRFTNTFKVGDTITINGETVAISAIASNTSMTTAAITNANSGVAYTLVGGTRFSVLGNGNVGINATAPGAPLQIGTGTSGGTILYRGLILSGGWSSTAQRQQNLITFKATNAVNANPFDDTSGESAKNFHMGLLSDTAFMNTTRRFSIIEQGAERFTVQSGGNVGIGTTTPASKLEVASTNQNTLTLSGVGAGGINVIYAKSAHTGTTALLANDWLLSLAGAGYGATGYSALSKIRLDMAAEENWTDTAQGTYFAFLTTAPGGTTRSEKVRIAGSGNVGIGTTTPGQLLEVAGASGLDGATPPTIKINSTNSGTWTDDVDYARLDFGNADTSGLGTTATKARISAKVDEVSGTNSALAFFTSNGTALTEKMRIDVSGNIGIGETNPGVNVPAGFVGGRTLEILATGDTGIFLRRSTSFGLDIWHDQSTGQSYIDNRYANAAGNIYFRTQTNGTPVNALTILGTGNIGIGTTAPLELLQVGLGGDPSYSSNPDKAIQISSTTDNDEVAFQLYVNEGTTNRRAKLFLDDATATFGLDASWSGGTPKMVFQLLGDTKMSILNDGKVGMGAERRALILASASAAVSYSRIDSYKYGTGAGYLPLVLNSGGGNVGIGTTAPGKNTGHGAGSAKFDVVGNIRLNTNSVATSGEIDSLQFVKKHTTGIDALYSLGEIRSVTYNGYDGGLAFYTGRNLGSGAYGPVHAMTINNTGNVGIGTTNPTYKLSVVGTSATSQLFLNDGSTGGGTVTSAAASGITIMGGARYASTYYALATAAGGMNVYNGTLSLYNDAGLTVGNSYTPTARLTINSSGNVGIGTTNPSQILTVSAVDPVISMIDTTGGGHEYQIRNGLTGSNFEIYDNTAGATRLQIDTDGQVGLGAAPINEARLFVLGNTSNGANVDIRSANALTPATLEVQAYDFDTSFKSAYLQYNGSGTLGNVIDSIPRANSSVLVFQESANSLIYTTYTSPLIFGTNSTERMRISDTGNIGIGDTTPDSILDVEQTNSTANLAVTTAQVTLTDSGTLNTETTKNALSSTLNASGNYNSGGFGAQYRLNGILANATYSGILNSLGGGDDLFLSGVDATASWNGTVVDASDYPVAYGIKALSEGNMGTTTGSHIGGSFLAYGTAYTNYGIYASATGATNNYAAILMGGSVGIGDLTPDALLDVKGTVCLDLNADDVCTDNTSALSDSRLKTKVIDIQDSLSLVRQLRPVRFTWNGLNNTGNADSLGFLAQEVEDIFPELVITDTAGYKNLDYSKLTAVLAGSIQELDLNLSALSGTITPLEGSETESFVNAFFANLFTKITVWLADAGNGIGEVFATEIKTKSLCVSDENGEQTCISKAQLDALLINATITPQQTETSPTPDPEETTPPLEPTGSENPASNETSTPSIPLETESDSGSAVSNVTPEPIPEETTPTEEEPAPETTPESGPTLETGPTPEPEVTPEPIPEEPLGDSTTGDAEPTI